MITRQQAALQIGRFSIFGLSYTRLEPKDVDEYIRALMYCSDEPDASGIITECIHEMDRLPPVAAIIGKQRGLAEARSYKEIPDSKPGEYFYDRNYCGKCEDNGFFVDDEGDTGWHWCDCPKGASRRELEPKLVPEAQAAWEKLHARCAGAAARAVEKAL